MNRIYRLVWNRALGVMQVASELTRSAGGTASSATSANPLDRRRPLAMACTLAFTLAATTLSLSAHADGGRGANGPDGTSIGGTGGAGGTAANPIGTAGTTGSTWGAGGGGGSTFLTGGQAGQGAAGGASAGGAAGGSGGGIGLLSSSPTTIAGDVFGGAGTAGTSARSGSGGGGGGFALSSSASDGTTQIALGANVTGGAGGGGGASGDGFAGAGGGGQGGGSVLFNGSNSILANSGDVVGGAGGTGGSSSTINAASGGDGGTGALFNGSAEGLNNDGSINGGAGGAGGISGQAGFGGNGGAGGMGVAFASAPSGTVTNSGSIAGGNGGVGGSNGYNYAAGGGGAGGTGLSNIATGSLTNTGSITGGNGGGAGASAHNIAGGAGVGGTGIVWGDATGLTSALVNSGTIAGGNAGARATSAGGALGASAAGGVAIIGRNLDIVDSGNIIGGLDATGSTHANAITFAGGSNTLELQSGYSIVGNVAGTGTDTLVLGGSAPAALNASVLGTQYTGFNHFNAVGPATWTLVGSTTAVTPWTISGGTLSISADAALGNSSGRLTLSGGMLEVSGSTTSNRSITLASAGQIMTDTGVLYTVAGAIGESGTSSLTKLGAGTLVLAGNNTYSGGTTVSAGTLQIGNGVSGALSGNIDNDGAVVFNLPSNTSFGGLVSGAGSLTQMGSGTLTLTADDTYTGGTTIGAGATLQLGANGSSGSVRGNIVDNGTLIVDHSNAVALINSISGTGSVVESGSGTLTINDSQSYSGITRIAVGSALELAQTGSIANSVVDAAGVFDISGLSAGASIKGLSGDGVVSLGANTLTLSNPNAAFGGTIQGIGTAGLTIASGSETLTGNNSYSGDTLVGGTLMLGGNGSIAPSDRVVDNGTFDISTHTGDATVQSLSGFGQVVLGNNGLILSNANDSFTGAISGAGSFTVNAGIETLTGINTYIGATTIADGGTLMLNGNGGILSSSSTLLNGTLDTSNSVGTGVNELSGHGSVLLGVETLDLFGNSTFAGTISGAGTLFQTSGQTVLTGNNDYTGVTLIEGNLSLQGSGSIAASSMVIDLGTLDISGTSNGASMASLSGNGTVQLGGQILSISNGISSFDGNIAGSGGLTVNGGFQTLTGNNTYTGTTTINGGTLLLNGNGSIAASSGVVDNGTFDISGTTSGASATTLSGAGSVVLGNQTLTLTAASDTFSGVISGNGGLAIASGTEILTGENTYTGGSSIAGGATLQIGNGGITGSITGDVLNNGTLDFDHSDEVTFGGVISGTGDLVKDGAGTLTLTGANTYTGQTILNDGEIDVAGNGSIASSGGFIVNSKLDISGTNNGLTLDTLAGSGQVILGSQTLTLSNASDTFAGNIQGQGGLTIAGGTETLTGSNDYLGATTVDSGATLALAGTGSIASSQLIDNGTLDVSGSTGGAAITSLTGNGAVQLGAQTLSLLDANDTFDGVIAGSGGITLDNGTETLTGANTYTGVTSIDGGTLALSGNGSIADSSSVFDNGTFDIGTTQNGASIASLSGNGSVTLGTQTLTLSAASETFGGVVSGQGGLTVAGGTETLSGINTYTGITAIDNGGTLALVGAGSVASSSQVVDNGTFDITGASQTTSVASLAGGGTVNLGSQSLELSNADDIFGGVINGNGGLTLDSGIEGLAGANTYTGATTINGGVLVLLGPGSVAASSSVIDNGTLDISVTAGSGATINSLAGNGTVTLGAQTLSLASAQDSFGGVIAGTGGLTVDGGMETLTGSNTYTGATTINGGTLAVAGAGSIVTSSGVIDNGTFDISAATQPVSISTLSGTGAVQLGAQTLALTNANGSFGGAIGGSGGLEIDGGSETLTGNSTYSGGTTIHAGSLQLGNGGTIGTIAGDVKNNGTLVFDHSDDISYAGTVSGSGKVVKLNSDVLTLTGNNSFSGGTSLESGSLVVGNASALGSGTLAMAEGTALGFGGSFTLANAITLSGDPTVDVAAGVITTLSGSIADGSQAGDLVKTGAGTLLLSGASTYTGSTTVSAGTLNVEGSAVSVVDVNNGASLTGAGSIGGLTVDNGGSVTPGRNGVGTLTVNGNATLAAGSNYHLNVDNTGATNSIHATGTATLGGGSVIVLAAGSQWRGSTTYTVLTADHGISGAFGQVSSNFAFLTPTMSYDADHAFLKLARNDVNFADIGITPNERSVGAAVQHLSDTSAVYNAVLVLDAAQARTALDQLTGASIAGTRTAIINDSRYIRDAISDHLQGNGYTAQTSEGSVWTSTWGHWGNNSGSDGVQRQTADGSGLLIGADHSLGAVRLGGVLGHSQLSNGTLSQGNAHSTATEAGLYAAADMGPWQWQAGAAHSWYETRTNRNVDLPGVGGNLDSSYNSRVTQAYVDGGYQLHLGNTTLMPFVNVAREWYHQDGSHEIGNAAALDVNANSSAINEGTAGLRANFTSAAGLQWHASLGWRHPWGDLPSISVQHFAGTANDFVVNGVPVAKNAGIVDAGLSFALRSNVSVDASYHGEFGGQVKDESARLNLTIGF